MGRKIGEYPISWDVPWIAADRKGQVGVFITAGEGPVPAWVLNNAALPLENIGRLVQGLPVVSGARLLIGLKRPDDYLEMAARGLYAYDWVDVHRRAVECSHCYEPIAVPTHPLTLDALPELLRVM